MENTADCRNQAMSYLAQGNHDQVRSTPELTRQSFHSSLTQAESHAKHEKGTLGAFASLVKLALSGVSCCVFHFRQEGFVTRVYSVQSVGSVAPTVITTYAVPDVIILFATGIYY